jgi:nucleoside-diphosphate-sugar epimerase
MRILVSGATGFIGNHVIEELLKYNHKIIATSRNKEKAKIFTWFNKVEYVEYNLDKKETDAAKLFKKPDILIHLAWDNLSDYQNPVHIEKIFPENLYFIKTLIESGLKEIVAVGSCFEYGFCEGKINEETKPCPVTNYGKAKLALLNSIMEFKNKYSFNLRWIRLFYIYGKDDTKNSLIKQLDNALKNNDEYFNMSAGDQIRDFLSIEKTAEYIVKIALQNKINGIINCASGNPVAVKDFIKKYLKEQNKSIKLNTGFYPYKDYEPVNFWSDTTKLDKIINLKH